MSVDVDYIEARTSLHWRQLGAQILEKPRELGEVVALIAISVTFIVLLVEIGTLALDAHAGRCR